MRLIDADDLREKFKERYMAALEWKNKTFLFQEKAEEAVTIYLEVVRTLDNAPTIDAVPTKSSDFYPCADENGMVGK